jgi:uncharacterized damage-inducible protein DinB
MANYNRSMNERLYECCAGLSEEARKRNSGAFFKSIHGTLNHLLVGDRVWLGRFTGRLFTPRSLDQELYSDFTELRSERALTDAAIEAWAGSLTDPQLVNEFEYVSFTAKKSHRFPFWFVVTHFFNHQSHHRGQLTTLLSQQGIDPGVTDLITFPISTSR